MEICKKCGGIAEWNSYYGGITCTRCGYVEKPKPSHYEQIRAMSVEEMAEKIGESIDCGVCKKMHHSENDECPSNPHQACVDFWLDWLNTEANEMEEQ